MFFDPWDEEVGKCNLEAICLKVYGLNQSL